MKFKARKIRACESADRMSVDIPAEKVWPTPRQIRAARSLAGIDQATLSKSAKVSRKTIVAIENDQSETMDYRRVKALDSLRQALEEKHDIEFLKASGTKGVGVRLRR